MDLYLELGGEYNPDLQHIHKQILEQKKSPIQPSKIGVMRKI